MIYLHKNIYTPTSEYRCHFSLRWHSRHFAGCRMYVPIYLYILYIYIRRKKTNLWMSLPYLPAMALATFCWMPPTQLLQVFMHLVFYISTRKFPTKKNIYTPTSGCRCHISRRWHWPHSAGCPRRSYCHRRKDSASRCGRTCTVVAACLSARRAAAGTGWPPY